MIDDSGTYLQPQQSGLGAAAALMRARGRERVTVGETSSAAVSEDESWRVRERPRSALVAAPVGSPLFGFPSE